MGIWWLQLMLKITTMPYPTSGAAPPRSHGVNWPPTFSGMGSTNGAWPRTFVWFPCHNHCPYSTNRCAKCEVCWTNLIIIIQGSDFRDPGAYPKKPGGFWVDPPKKTNQKNPPQVKYNSVFFVPLIMKYLIIHIITTVRLPPSKIVEIKT